MKKLIIGATGSIGSAVSRNIQKNGGKTHLVGRNEKEISSLANELGSSFTVADVLNENFSDKIISDLGNEEIDGYDCWKIELIPNEDAPVVWGKLVMWIDKTDYMQLKTEFYDEYEDMVSVMTSNQIKDFNGKKLPSIIEYVPLDEDGNKTIIERLVWQFDIDINQRYFLPSYMKNLR